MGKVCDRQGDKTDADEYTTVNTSKGTVSSPGSDDLNRNASASDSSGFRNTLPSPSQFDENPPAPSTSFQKEKSPGYEPGGPMQSESPDESNDVSSTSYVSDDDDLRVQRSPSKVE